MLVMQNKALLPSFYSMWQNLKPEIKNPLWNLALFPPPPFSQNT